MNYGQQPSSCTDLRETLHTYHGEKEGKDLWEKLHGLCLLQVHIAKGGERGKEGEKEGGREIDRQIQRQRRDSMIQYLYPLHNE